MGLNTQAPGGPGNSPPSDWDFWRYGLDRAFFSRVYVRATQIAVVGILVLLGFDQKSGALGLLMGTGMGLFSLWTLEATAKLLFNGGRGAGWRLALAALFKGPLMLSGLAVIAYCARNDIANAFAICGGVLLVHTVMFIMVVATALAQQDSIRERYR